jgi:hypothetical protein
LQKEEIFLSSRAGLSKKGIARTLRGHFFELFDCTSGIKEIHHFLPDFRALKNRIFRFHAKKGTWTSQKPRKMGHTLYGKDPHQKS